MNLTFFDFGNPKALRLSFKKFVLAITIAGFLLLWRGQTRKVNLPTPEQLEASELSFKKFVLAITIAGFLLLWWGQTTRDDLSTSVTENPPQKEILTVSNREPARSE